MERADGESDAKPRLQAGVDRLSALPGDVLIDILLKLQDAAAAARTSVLSRHWRRLWALLPELCFHPATGPQGIRAALESHEAPVLRRLSVAANGATPESLAAWLLIAAPRLSGDLKLVTAVARNEIAKGAPIELPCFEKATAICLNLGFLALALPPLGVFTRLTDLFLACVNLHGPCVLGDVVSSPRCPALRRLTVQYARGRQDNFAIQSDSLLEIELLDLQPDNALGLGNFTIHSESLLKIQLANLHAMQRLTVFAPALQVLNVTHCFAQFAHDLTYNQPVANICAPQLRSLNWKEAYDPSSTKFSNMENLKWVGTFPFLVYGQDPHRLLNSFCLRLIQRFQLIRFLRFMLNYLPDITNKQYLMEDIPRLPGITRLALDIKPNGHSFGAGVFHVLRMCTGVRKLLFTLMYATGHVEAQTACPSGCVCDQPPNWKTQELALKCLQEVRVHKLRGTEHEAALIERLFDWATVLEKMTIAFHGSVPESKAKEFFQMLQSFSRPGICLKGPHFA